LLITLKGRALDSTARSSFLHDDLAAELADRLDHDLGTVSLGLGVHEGIVIRTSILDRAGDAFVRTHPTAVVVELASGLQTRMAPTDPPATVDCFDGALPAVIALREAIMPVRENAPPVGVSLLSPQWTQAVPAARPTILVSDGLLGFLA